MIAVQENKNTIFMHRYLKVKAVSELSAMYISAMHGGTSLYSKIRGELYDFSTCAKKPYFIYSDIWAPKKFPRWCKDRSMLWNKLEKYCFDNNRGEDVMAIEISLSLPLNLSNESYISMTKAIAFNDLIGKLMIADVNIHLSKRNDPHAHFLLPLYHPDKEDFLSQKIKLDISAIKSNWVSGVNDYVRIGN